MVYHHESWKLGLDNLDTWKYHGNDDNLLEADSKIRKIVSLPCLNTFISEFKDKTTVIMFIVYMYLKGSLFNNNCYP